MDRVKLSALPTLSRVQQTALKNGGLLSVADLVLALPNEIARKCRISSLEVQGIIDLVCRENLHQIRRLENAQHEGDEIFTTGDVNLDNAVGGGIRTGMIWEVVGESASGKTQFGLQLSLLVQIPPELGGLSGSACYLTTSSTLPTSRLVQISEAHPLLSPSLCSLSDIHTLAIPTIPIAIQVLTKILPDFINDRSGGSKLKPVKFVVIDALAELFHSNNKTTTTTLVERSRNVTEISTLLHALASTHQVAILVLNEVVDAFDRTMGVDGGDVGDLVYSDQSQWFSRADSVPGENGKEASLGLVWANQVNARILFSRTGRRRYLEDGEARMIKRQKFQEYQPDLSTTAQPALIEHQPTLIRRLSVIFSPVSYAISLDYIVTMAGISILPGDQPVSREVKRPVSPIEHATTATRIQPDSQIGQISPLDVGLAQDGDTNEGEERTADLEDEDEWEAYWKQDAIPDDAYNEVSWDVNNT